MKRRKPDPEREALEREVAKAVLEKARGAPGVITRASLEKAIREVLEQIASEGEIVMRPRVVVVTTTSGGAIRLHARVEATPRAPRGEPAKVYDLATRRLHQGPVQVPKLMTTAEEARHYLAGEDDEEKP